MFKGRGPQIYGVRKSVSRAPRSPQAPLLPRPVGLLRQMRVGLRSRCSSGFEDQQGIHVVFGGLDLPLKFCSEAELWIAGG